MAENNAQVREPSLRRKDFDVLAEDARRLLADPAVQRVLENMETNLVNAIIKAPTSTPEDIENERELVRQLRTTRGLKMQLFSTTQMQDLQDSDFKSQAADPEPVLKPAEVKPYVPGIKEI